MYKNITTAYLSRSCFARSPTRMTPTRTRVLPSSSFLISSSFFIFIGFLSTLPESCNNILGNHPGNIENIVTQCTSLSMQKMAGKHTVKINFHVKKVIWSFYCSPLEKGFSGNMELVSLFSNNDRLETDLWGKMITDFLECGLSVPNNLLYPL